MDAKVPAISVLASGPTSNVPVTWSSRTAAAASISCHLA